NFDLIKEELLEVNPNFNFDTDAQNYYNSFKGYASNPATGHRFGAYDYLTKDMGSSGFWEHYRQEPAVIVHYLLSCGGGNICNKKYMDALRFHLYASAHIVNYAPGFEVLQHPEANLQEYRSPTFDWGLFGTCSSDPKDRLGYCLDVNAGSQYRQDANGVTHLTYNGNNIYAVLLWHGWTIRDSSHMSLGMELYRYMFTGDYVARFLAKSQIDGAGSAFNYDFLHNTFGDQTRARGRALLNIAKLFSVTGNSDYKTIANRTITIIDALRNKDTVSSGINPVTGDPLPIKYFDAPGGFFCDDLSTNSCRILLYENVQILHGLAVAYHDAITDTDVLNLIQNMLNDGLYFVFNFAYKRYNSVKNAIIGGNNVNVYEGEGGFGGYNRIIIGPQPGFNILDMTGYTRYQYAIYPHGHQLYQ
ncbi:MAG: hypothetical protein AABY07_01705, partial [Nanoarchaeota archaeon]